MRGARVLMLTLLAIVAAARGGSEDDNDVVQSEMDSRRLIDRLGFVEDAITDALELLRENPTIYPSLDFLGRTREIDSGSTKLTVSFRNAEVIGLPDFVTENVTYLVPASKVELTLSFDELIISGENYGIFGVIAGVLNMNGEGPFELRFGKANLDANARATVSLDPAKIELKDLIADITIQTFTMEMVNIFGPGNLTNEFNIMMSTIGIDILHLYKDQIDAKAAGFLEDLLNGLLSDLLSKSSRDAKQVQEAATQVFTVFVEGTMEMMQEIVSELYTRS